MNSNDRRVHPRYPAWFPINVRIDDEPFLRPAMLCDVSIGGALVWGFWEDSGGESALLDVSFRSAKFELPARVVSVERQWDTVILHLEFPAGMVEGSPRLNELIGELKAHFEAYQVYLAHRADDDPSLGRTATQYPGDRASA
ncbi:MAG: PilZ domain-containing protein [Dehalococcoidia bacterium]